MYELMDVEWTSYSDVQFRNTQMNFGWMRGKIYLYTNRWI